MTNHDLPSDAGTPARGRFSSIAVGVVVLLCLLVVNLPGEPTYLPDILGNGKYGPHFEIDPRCVEHGWPYRFLTHEGEPKGWSFNASPWRIGKNAKFHALAFFVDSSIATALAYAAFKYAQRRVRLRGWQISVREFALAVFCISVPFALLVRRRTLHEAQVKYLTQHSTMLDVEYADWEPFGPYWLRRWTGDKYWKWGDRLIGLDAADSVHLADFPGKEYIQVLQVMEFDCKSPPSLAAFSNLKAVDVMTSSGDELTRDSIDWRFAIAELARCRDLSGLNLYEGGVSNRDLRTIGTMANLENLCLSVNYAIDDRGLMHLASLKKLRTLELFDTDVTAKGIARLQEELPNCTIYWNGSDAP